MINDFNPFSLNGKKIVVTGASSGIGRQCAIDCSQMGATVVLIGRNGDRLKETIDLMDGVNHIYLSVDLNEIQPDFIQNIVQKIGRIDGLVYAAGIEKTLPLKYIGRLEYEMLMNTNTFSAFELIRQLSNKKNMSDGASIVLISSISSIIARVGLSAYAASKGALNSASKVFALELSKRHIRVNCILPGTILTNMMQEALSQLSEEDQIKRISGFPLGLGDPVDVSYAAIYLLSDASKWVMGQNIVIDGGYTAK